jgi:predicted nucleic acid-binding protein
VKWLLDTNVVSEATRDRPHRNVINWIAAQAPEELAISAVTLAELTDGATSNPNETRRRKLTSWIEVEVSNVFRDRTLSLTPDILIDWLRLGRRLRAAGRSTEAADLLIASTARVHNLTLVSRNVRDFADTGIVVYDPWSAKSHVMDAI